MASDAEYVRMANTVYADKGDRSAPLGWRKYGRHADGHTSGLQGSVFINDVTKEVVFAFAGTNELKDAGADADFVTGGYHNQFRDALDFVHRTLATFENLGQFTDYSFSTTGHSLGGAHAQIISHTFGWNGRTFDPPEASKIVSSQGYLNHLTRLGISAKGIGDGFTNFTESGSLVSVDLPNRHHLGKVEELNLRSNLHYLLKGVVALFLPKVGAAALTHEAMLQHSLNIWVNHFAPDIAKSFFPKLQKRLDNDADFRENYKKALVEIGKISTPENSKVYDGAQYLENRLAFVRALALYFSNDPLKDTSQWNIPGLNAQNAPEVFSLLLRNEGLASQLTTTQSLHSLLSTSPDVYKALAKAAGARHVPGTYTLPDANFKYGKRSNYDRIVATGRNSFGESFIVRESEVDYWLKRAQGNGIYNLDRRTIIRSLADGAADLGGPEGMYRYTGGLRGGTSFDSSSYGFGINTTFFHGSRGRQLWTNRARDLSIRNDSLLIHGGNYKVTSLTVNTPGFFVVMNSAIGDGYQPGRNNVIQTMPPHLVANVCNGPFAPQQITVDIPYIMGWTSRRAEIDPLVVDLDGDGVELTPFGDGYLFFDIDNDGHKERTGWVGADDGMLVHDLNGDGKINDITETLSEYYGAAKGTGAVYESSFEALASLDTNNDGKIDSSDSAFGNLRVWRDANQNGETDDGELKSLAEMGITELSLNDSADGSFLSGNEVKSRSSYLKSDGSRAVMAAINFIADPSGLKQEADGAGTRIELEDGSATYSVGGANGETVNAASKNVANIIGGTGNDVLIGDDGNNWLVGSLGEDQLRGGAGNDYLVADAADIANTQDNIQGGAGFDVVQFVGDTGVSFNLQNSQVEMAIGTDKADILVSGSSDQSIINGGGGDDIITGGSASDVLNGEEGDDAVYGHRGNDLLRGHRGADKLIGGDGDDILQGGLGRDILSGDAGEDLLDGGAGDDLLDGGAGYDVAQYSGSYADYTVTANANGTYTVTDRRDGSPDGTDTLKNIEALNFADLNEMEIDGGNPLPVKDLVRVNAEQDGKTYRIAISDLLANDLDYQGDSLSLREAFGAEGGTVSIDGDEIVFVVDDGFKGIPSFSYRIADEHGNNGRPIGILGTDSTAEMAAKVSLVLDHHPDDPQFVNQWYLPEINVLPVWNNYTGAGIRIGVFEPGPWDAKEYGQIDYSHPDLLPNIDAESLRTQNPNIEPTQHATMVAGIIGAARNDLGGVGVAYNVTLVSEGITASDLNPLLNWRHYDIVNNSWGLKEQFSDAIYYEEKSWSSELFELAVRLGRGRLGTTIVMGGGNSRQDGHDTNAFDLTNNRYSIKVGAVNAEGDIGNLRIAEDPFSNPGASILVSAPGSNVTSTSRMVENENGSTFGSNYDTAKGTSFAAPIVSGVVALMLEANPLLGWRDVQEILALSAKRIDDPNTEWKINGAANWNGGGMHYSHDYGFGLIDAHAAVRLAETWKDQSTWYNEAKYIYQSGDLNQAIRDGRGQTSHTISVTDQVKVENVEVLLDLRHTQMGDVEIVLRGPDGTESILINRPGVAPDGDSSDRGHGSFDKVWMTATTNHWGEDSVGNWTLMIRDKVSGETGVLRDWELRLYGQEASEDTTYFYTSEFGVGQHDSHVITDGSGVNTINASAVSLDSQINISYGSTSIINGHNVRLFIASTSEDDKRRRILDVTNEYSPRINSLERTISTNQRNLNAARNRKVRIENQLKSLKERYDEQLSKYDNLREWYDTRKVLYVSGNQVLLRNESTGATEAMYVSEYNDRVNEMNSVAKFLRDAAKEYNSLVPQLKSTSSSIDAIQKTIPPLQLELETERRKLQEAIDHINNGEAGVVHNVYAGDGDDVIYGNGAINTLSGGRGNDILHAAFEEGSPVAGNKFLLTGDTLVRSLGNGVDILTIDNASEFYATDTRVSAIASDGKPVVTARNHFTGFNINEDLIDLRTLDSVTSFDDLTISNRVIHIRDRSSLGRTTWARITTKAGGMILLAGVDAADITAGHFLFSGQDYGDILLGGAGDDTLYGSLGADRLLGGAGLDTAAYANSAAGIDISLQDDGSAIIASTGGDADGDELQDIENLSGSAHADNLVGNAHANILSGAGGDDVLTGGGGADRLFGGDGDDTAVFRGKRSEYTVTLNDDGDFVIRDSVTGRDGEATANQIENYRFSDVTVSSDHLQNYNPEANDDAVSTTEDRSLTILAADLLRNDKDADGDSLTLTSVSNAVNGTVALNDNGNVVFTPLSGFFGTARFDYTVSDGYGGKDTATVIVEVEADNTIRGTSDDNVLSGGKEDNLILGFAGNDRLSGGWGNDVVKGGTGDDVIYGDKAVGYAKELVVNGSFESHGRLNRGRWGLFARGNGVAGWSTPSGQRIEIQEGAVAGAPPTSRYNSMVELDSHYGNSNTTIYQDINISDDGTYTLSFSYSARAKRGANTAQTSKMEIWFGGKKIDVIEDGQVGFVNKTYTIQAVEGRTRLSFVGVGRQDTYGALLDNVSLRRTPTTETFDDTLYGDAGNDRIFGGEGNDLIYGDDPDMPETGTDSAIGAELIVNGTFESHGSLNRGRWGLFSEGKGVAGWSAPSGQRIEIQEGAISGASTPRSNSLVELDSHYSNSNTTIYQDVQVNAAGLYFLTFDYSARAKRGADTADTGKMEIWFAGKRIDVIDDGKVGFVNKTYVVEAAVGTSRLTFVGAGRQDTYGALLDNVSFRRAGDVGNADVLHGGIGNDTLYGGGGVDLLSGGSGNDFLDGGSGNDHLTGGAGRDTYAVNRGGGAERVNNQGRLADGDRILFGDGIAADQLWFSRVGNDLRIQVMGRGSQVDIAGWYTNSRNRVHSIETSNGATLYHKKVQELVSVMASFGPPSSGQTDLTAAQHERLDGVIAASWQGE